MLKKLNVFYMKFRRLAPISLIFRRIRLLAKLREEKTAVFLTALKAESTVGFFRVFLLCKRFNKWR